MPTGEITGYIDVAQLALYAFWIFFAGLIVYLRREDRREGYPLESDRPGGRRGGSFDFLFMPPPKTFRLPHGGTYQAPPGTPDTTDFKARRSAAWSGSPFEPTGKPMLDGVGPAAYPLRRDEPEKTLAGLPLIVPMRLAGATVEERDADPRGMPVVGADRRVAGEVTDLWVDRSEPQVRYLEVEVQATAGLRRVLLPIYYARINGAARRVEVGAILASQFADVPATTSLEQVTKLEEDKITAYFASGYLYATPARVEPLL